MWAVRRLLPGRALGVRLRPTTPTAGGWIANKLAAVDFAGGTAVHINAGAAALAVAIVLGKRATWGQAPRPHNVPLTLLGAGLLWAGWYAFNGGSALTAGHSASVVMLTTFTATCAAMLAWLAVEKLKHGHATAVGAASGAIAGLVAITPACGAVTPVGALVLGADRRRRSARWPSGSRSASATTTPSTSWASTSSAA